ncbi:MAG: ABC transporter substrate-binding protein [Alphaproteobacteria bacterium]|nr:ABC transporter substrate-binding protein [Alphaproteobacteria bacterium]
MRGRGTRSAIRALALAVSAGALWAGPAAAQKTAMPGVTDAEIKIGQTMPYSGPASAYGVIGKAELAFFKMLNEKGGINGRKVTLMSLDDGYSPPKAVEQVRKLVEQEKVAVVFHSVGTAVNTAVQPYLNKMKVPQLFVATGASKWADPERFPWTMGWQPDYHTEAMIYAKYVMTEKPDAKIGILYQNDDFGKDYLRGLQDGLGDKLKAMLVKEVTYEVGDPTVDSQIVTLQGAGVDVLITIATPKFAAQAIRKVHDIAWKPLHLITNVSSSIGGTLAPAGLDKSVGLITALYQKVTTDPRWENDQGYKDWLAWMKAYNPDADVSDGSNVTGYNVAMTLVQVLKQYGDDLSRANIMRQAASLKDFELPMLMPGIKINTGPKDFKPIEQVQLMRFDGRTWQPLGNVLGY